MKKSIIIFFLLIPHYLNSQTGDWKTYLPVYDKIPYIYVSTVVGDMVGNIWIGTSVDGAAIGIYDGEKWIQYNKQNSEIRGYNLRTIVVVDSG